MTYFIPRWVEGRRIVKVELRSQKDENGTHHDPVFILDNGARVTFLVTESNTGGFYGVQPIYAKPEKSK
jgi:hypothetical protein